MKAQISLLLKYGILSILALLILKAQEVKQKTIRLAYYDALMMADAMNGKIDNDNYFTALNKYVKINPAGGDVKTQYNEQLKYNPFLLERTMKLLNEKELTPEQKENEKEKLLQEIDKLKNNLDQIDKLIKAKNDTLRTTREGHKSYLDSKVKDISTLPQNKNFGYKFRDKWNDLKKIFGKQNKQIDEGTINNLWTEETNMRAKEIEEDQNTFIQMKEELEGKEEKINALKSQSDSQTNKPNVLSVASASGVGLEATIINGASVFLANRFKEEINQYFLEQFGKYLKDERVQYLFPSTSALLQSGKQQWTYSSMLQLLKSSLQADLLNIHKGIPEMFDKSPAYRDLIATNSNVQLLLTVSNIYKNVAQGEHPADIFSDIIGFMDNKNITDPQLNKILLIIQTWSNLLRESGVSDNAWISAKKYSELDSLKREFVYGLLLQSILFDKINMNEVLKESKKDSAKMYLVYKTSIDKYFTMLSDIDRLRLKIAKYKSEEKDTKQLWNDYVEQILLLLEESLTSQQADLMVNDSTKKENFSKYVSISRSARQLYHDIQQQNYSSIASSSLSILKTLNIPLPDQVFRYTSFLASVAEAQSGEQVAQAIESASLPAGSYLIKRRSSFDVSLNAFVGFSIADEFSPNAHNAVAFGLPSAPIGLAFSCADSEGNAHSLMLSIIDLGIPLNGRLSGDTSQFNTNAKLANILSPGIYIFWHFKDSPFSFSFNPISYSPKLRDIPKQPNRVSVWHCGIMMSIDIPIFSFYSNPIE